MLKLLPALLIAVFTCAPLAAAGEARPERLPVSYFFKNVDIAGAALSPNGRYLATTTRKLGNLQLAVLDLDTNEAKVVAGFNELDIVNVNWLNDERIAFSVIDRSMANNTAAGLYTVARTGGKPVALIATFRDLQPPLTGTTIVAMQPIRPAKDGKNVLVEGYIMDGWDARPLLVNASTARRTELEFDLPGKPLRFLFDGKDDVRAAITATGEDRQTQQVWFRDSPAAKWRMLASFPTLDPALSVVGMVGDSLYVSAPAGPHWGLYKYDTVKNKLGELVLADPEVDVTGPLLVQPGTDALLGVSIGAEPPRTHWFDPAYASLQKAVDRAYPEHVNVIVPAPGDAPRLVHSYSATDPGRVLRYVPATRKLTSLFQNAPWVEPAKMADKVVFDYKARDGLPIMAYLTLPKGRALQKLPLIVLPHGGPHARDQFGFNGEVQFLTNRGYAVLQPQFRGSTGFGLAHIRKGFRQWGLAMQDDLTDGVRTLAAQGIIDPRRVCIMGASYGGYAAMMGIAKDPDQYRCAVNLLGVTDLVDLLKSGRWNGDAFRSETKTVIGDMSTMRADLERTSPVTRAADMKAPVFMAYGEKDRRVPLSHGGDMRDALKKAGKPAEWMSFPNEEHGFAHEENRFKVYGGIEAFLQKHNPAD